MNTLAGCARLKHPAPRVRVSQSWATNDSKDNFHLPTHRDRLVDNNMRPANPVNVAFVIAKRNPYAKCDHARRTESSP